MYSYDALSLDFTRIVEIHPGQYGDPITISLHPERFDLLTGPSSVFEALSYTWGSMENPRTIQVLNDQDGELRITQNLDCALRHFRRIDRSRFMWIDAIYINQSSDVEKGQQDSKMGNL